MCKSQLQHQLKNKRVEETNHLHYILQVDCKSQLLQLSKLSNCEE